MSTSIVYIVPLKVPMKMHILDLTVKFKDSGHYQSQLIFWRTIYTTNFTKVDSYTELHNVISPFPVNFRSLKYDTALII